MTEIQEAALALGRELGATRIFCGKSGFQVIATYLVPDLEADLSKASHFEWPAGRVGIVSVCFTLEDFEKMCHQQGLSAKDEIKIQRDVEEDERSIFSKKLRNITSVPTFVRESAVRVIWRQDLTFLPYIKIENRQIWLIWEFRAHKMTVKCHIFGVDMHCSIDLGREIYEVKNMTVEDFEFKTARFFKFIDDINNPKSE